jgi:hypothetical protein
LGPFLGGKGKAYRKHDEAGTPQRLLWQFFGYL